MCTVKKIYQEGKEIEKYNHDEGKKSQSIETKPEMGQMLELTDKDIGTAIIYKPMSYV